MAHIVRNSCIFLSAHSTPFSQNCSMQNKKTTHEMIV